MFNSIKIGWYAEDIGERIESGTAYVVDNSILMGLDIKTHDTIFIFAQIYSLVTHNKYGKILRDKGASFVNKLDEKLKNNEKSWLETILQIPMDLTTTISMDTFINRELDDFKNKWQYGYTLQRGANSSSNAGTYTYNRIKEYLIDLGHELPQNFYSIKETLEYLDAITKG